MPILSTLAASSIENMMWKKKCEAYDTDCCYCRCSCHQRQVRIAAVNALPTTSNVNSTSCMQTLETLSTIKKPKDLHVEKDNSSSTLVRRTPFRALNGRAYAVPISMAKEFDAVLQQARSDESLGVLTTLEGNSINFAPLNSPGVLWRHDPYSRKVLASTSSFDSRREGEQEKLNQEYDLTEIEEEENEEEYESNAVYESDVDINGTKEEVEENEYENEGLEMDMNHNNSYMEDYNYTYPYPAYGNASWNSMYGFHPFYAPVGSRTFYPTVNEAYHASTRPSTFSQVYENNFTPLMHAPPPPPLPPPASLRAAATITATARTPPLPPHYYSHRYDIATTENLKESLPYRYADVTDNVVSIMPSTRPRPPPSGRCVVFHSPPPQLPPSISASHSANIIPTSLSVEVKQKLLTFSVTGLKKAEEIIAREDESDRCDTQSNYPISRTKRTRSSHGGGIISNNNNNTSTTNHQNVNNDNNHFSDESEMLEQCLPTLAAFRALPPLFTDLRAHTTRRPPRPGQGPHTRRERTITRHHKESNPNTSITSSTTSSEGEELSYLYLVAHRCRRSVAAAPGPHHQQHPPGTLVVLEGDLGIEVGAVVAGLPRASLAALTPAARVARGFPSDGDVTAAARLLRPATVTEARHYSHTLREFASDLLHFLQHHLHPENFVDCQVENMEFLDCEFQADCKKIYVYYRAKKRVLFRELAQYLHSFYRCRIWLHEVGKDSSTLSGDSSREIEG